MAYDRCIFLGDDFGMRSFEKFFKTRKATDYNSYVKANFDVSGFFNNKFTSDNPSTLSRITNLLVSTLNVQMGGKRLPLPKLYEIVPDEDILKLLQDCDEDQLTQSTSRAVNFVMTEFERNVASFKESLPARCLREFPYFLWILESSYA